MKCKMCGGAGVVQGQAPGLVSCCPACDGKGFIEQTNEEWLRSATTEQLADFVVKAMILYDNSEMTVLEAIKNAVKNDVKLSNYFMESLLEWLKQPHTNE